MNEMDLRERLRDVAADAPKGVTMPPSVARRARRRTALTIGSSVLLGLSLVSVGLLAVRSLEGEVNEPAVTTSTSPPPSPTPLASAPPGSLAPGTYVLDLPGVAPAPPITFTVPRGWDAWDHGVLHKSGAEHMAVTFWHVDDVYSDPCHTNLGVVVPRPSVNAVADALAAQPRRHGTAPVDASIDGHAGKYVQTSVPAHLDFTDCYGHQFASWIGHEQQGPGQHDELWIVKVSGTVLVIDASYMPGVSDADRVQLRRIVRSVHFDQS
jgi:hypothetical protein